MISVPDWSDARRSSSITGLWHSGKSRLASWTANAAVVRGISRTRHLTASAVSDSLVAAGATRIRHWTSNSTVGAWLLQNAENDVIVVDLEQTRFLGPLLGAVHHHGGAATTLWSRSRTNTMLARRGSRLVDLFRSSWTGRILWTLLQPPDPPDGRE